MVVESGFRCHLTNFARATAAAPSVFVTRLRKYLRTRRVTSVAQVGTDRIIELQFSDGQFKLFLEFYAGGNIVLTDKELSVISLLRVVSEAQEQELRVGLKYTLENRQNYGGIPPLTKERVRHGLQRTLDKIGSESQIPVKKPKKKSGDSLRKALAISLTEFPPILIDHALRVKQFDPNISIETVAKDEALLDRLVDVLEEANRVVTEITNSGFTKGYIIGKPAKPRANTQEVESIDGSDDKENQRNLLYEDFHPFRPQQLEGDTSTHILEFNDFNATVDEFFSSIEAQKLESRLTEREEHAKRKLDTARQDHQKRVSGLQEVQELNVRKAQAIECNLDRVLEAINAINGLVAQGMDWVEIARLIEMEQARQNPVAEIVKLPLKLYENTVTFLLTEADFEDEEDFEGDETNSDISDSEDDVRGSSKPLNPAKSDNKQLSVDIDLGLSPWSNARQYYEQKKFAAIKEQKTLQSSAMALKSTEKKINADLKKGLKQEKAVLRPVRKQLWFEKFYYFISSEGYLVLGGRDAQQNEILYRRYLTKGDVYVHADLHGAASIIIKNKLKIKDAPIPPSTLSQAGTFSVATSSAWDSKAVMSAWWVNSDQVSKTAPSGEYLTTGSFVIKGKKNFLPPAQLLFGFGVMFQVSDESKARHLKHRLQNETSEATAGDRVINRSNSEAGSELGQDTDADHSDKEEHIGETTEIEHNIYDDDDDDEERVQRGQDDSVPNENRNNNDLSEYHNPLQSGHKFAETVSAKSRGISYDKIDDHSDEEPSEEGPHMLAPRNELDSEPPKNRSHLTDEKVDDETKTIPEARHESRRELPPLEDASLPDSIPIYSEHSTTPPSEPKNVRFDDSAAPPSSVPNGAPQKPQVRGKHGKRAKEKSKYANQDVEDKALALRLLGSTGSTAKAAAAATSKETQDAALAAAKLRRREQHVCAQKTGKEAEEARRLNFEEGIETLNEEEVAEMGLLENFIGTPLPGDEILDCLVICGPWDALGARFRWRVKIQPGMAKKGKAVREILGRWGSRIADREKRKGPGAGEEGFEEEKMMRREGELVKGLKEVEVVGCVPVGRFRVVMSGGGGGGKSGGGGKKGSGGAGKGTRGRKGGKRS